jgi:hypothetical protein
MWREGQCPSAVDPRVKPEDDDWIKGSGQNRGRCLASILRNISVTPPSKTPYKGAVTYIISGTPDEILW